MLTRRKVTPPIPLNNLDDTQVLARWKHLLPKLARNLLFLSVVAVLAFWGNRFGSLSQKNTDLLNVAFQITTAMAVCHAVLYALGRWVVYGLEKKLAVGRTIG